MKNKAQQEIVGFVLIVALVVVGLMVFLVITLRDTPTEKNSVEVENLLDTLMKKTTGCAISFEPQYENFQDLFKSCYKGKTCTNIEENTCQYLEKELEKTIGMLLETEATISSYQLDFLERENDGEKGILRVSEGGCNQTVSTTQKTIISGSDKLVIRMKVCKA